MVKVFVSRYTPNLENGENVQFEKGEVVDYRMRNGQEFKITIDSDLMQQGGYRGYEAIFPDDGQRYFVPARGIFNWEGKV